MPRLLGLVTFLALCFTTLVFGQVFASDLGDKKRNVTPSEGLAKAFKAADRLAAIEKGSNKVSALTSHSKKSKTSAKLKTKKVSGKKFASHKRHSVKKASLHKSRYAKKHSTIKSRSHKKHPAHRTKTTKRSVS